MTTAAIHPPPRPIPWVLIALAVLVLAAMLAASTFRWNMLRGPLAREASLLSGRQIVIDGDLHVHPWSWTPWATIGGLKVGNPAWMGGGLLADVPELTVKVRMGALFQRRADIVLLRLSQPKLWLYRRADGRANWTNQAPGEATRLPPIEHFVIDNGAMRMVDRAAGLTLAGSIWSDEGPALAGGGDFHFHGGGVRNGVPIALDIRGGPLIEIHPDRPYLFDADVRQRTTHLVAHGSLDTPFDFGRFHARLTGSGRSLSDLYDLLHLSLPNTPAFNLTGDLTREREVYTMRGLNGRVGSSDLSGEFTVDRTAERPRLHAELESRRLRFSDLGSLVGAPTAGDHLAASSASRNRMLPQATLNAAKLRALDAQVRYRADSIVTSTNLPLRQASVVANLDHGVLVLKPLAFDFPKGSLAGWLRLDANKATPTVDMDMTVRNVRLEDFFKGAKGGPPPLSGLVEARAQLHGVGDSVHAAASTADGHVTLVVPSGRIRQSLAELTGIDASKALGLILTKNQSDEGLRCAVADFRADHGVLRAQTLLLDADEVQARGQGQVDLANETLNLSLQGQPKKIRLIRLMAPITLTGSLTSPKVGVKAGKAALQAGAGVALAIVATPLAALLPFVDPGLAKNADCVGLASAANAKGAPVRPSQATPAKVKR
jgi:uncharacterized protein involved in outer membrane biogenesis